MTTTPSASDDLLALAASALDQGDPDGALELCRQLLAHEPLHLRALFLEAEAYRDLRETEEAEDRYRNILRLDPDHSEAWSGMGATMFDSYRFEEARHCFARALRAEPLNADGYYGRALLRERRGDHRGAQRDYVRAWRGSTNYPLPRTLTDAEIRRLLSQAAEGLDPAVGVALAQVTLVIQDLPDTDLCELYHPPASPAELLGHFSAPHAADREAGLPWSNLPPALIVFRKNLERYASEEEHLQEALRQTLLAHVADWLGVEPHHL